MSRVEAWILGVGLLLSGSVLGFGVGVLTFACTNGFCR